MYDYANDEMNNDSLIACNRTNGCWTDNMSAPHYHEFYEFYFQETGTREVFLNGTANIVSPGKIVICEPYQFHRSYSTSTTHSSYTRMLVYFKAEALSETLLKIFQDISGVYDFDNKITAKLSKILQQMMPENCTYGELNVPYRHAMLEVLLITFLNYKPQKQKTILNNQMSVIMNYINEHYSDKLSIDFLSRKFYVSSSLLCHEFKKYTDQSLIQYVNYTRILHAEKALISSSKTITDISYESGFDNISTFNRVFRSIANTTPSEFRKRHCL